jgi:hypothetical protein
VIDRNTWLRWTWLAVALFLLNISLSFANVWPTLKVRWNGDVAVEVAALILIATAGGLRSFSKRTLRVLTAGWMLLVIGHYADVTAPALYGHDINLYWDLQFVPAVTSMIVKAAPIWLVAAGAAAAVIVLALLYVVLRWALNQVGSALTRPRERLVLVTFAAIIVVLFIGDRLTPRNDYEGTTWFSRPVMATYAHQAKLVFETMTRSAELPASPPMRSDFSRVHNTDVVVMFMESYGAVTYERPELSAIAAPGRAALDSAIRDSGRDVVSAFVQSPTFGGGSWLAHISLLSGIEVRDPDINARLMATKRETLVTAFSRHGFKTVAWMPGLWQRWPEGGFYGFEQIYGGEQLSYKGPTFGWWDIPDQYSIAKLDAAELSGGSRRPLFVFFPTVTTHTPFTPVPPYQPDWARVLTDHPFDTSDVTKAGDEEADWENLGPAYATAISYSSRAIAGYLRLRPNRDFVLIVLGDHQPPALVSGPGASWDVPIHVIAKAHSQVLAHLRSHGFRSGLTPERPSLSHMHALVPVLLDAFGDATETPRQIATETQR